MTRVLTIALSLLLVPMTTYASTPTMTPDCVESTATSWTFGNLDNSAGADHWSAVYKDTGPLVAYDHTQSATSWTSDFDTAYATATPATYHFADYDSNLGGDFPADWTAMQASAGFLGSADLVYATSCSSASGGSGATSTIEQSQENLAHAVYIFFIALFGMVWLMRKH